MPSPTRRSATTRVARQRRFEALRVAGLLGMLPRASAKCSGRRRPSLRTPQEQPATPVASLQEGGRLWSVRVGSHHRALAAEADDGLVWFWIGTHADYDKLLC